MQYGEFKIAADEVHIWSARLDHPLASRGQLHLAVSPFEKARANRFHFKADRNRYLVGRGILRTLLGRYLDIEADQVQIFCDKQGKPVLAEDDSLGIHFNLSHSDGFALFAFARGGEVGVDVEHIREIPHMQQIIDRFFTSREKMYFHALPEGRKKDSFFRLWTRKEAYVKGTGRGLRQPLDSFEVLADSPVDVVPCAAEKYSAHNTQWQLHDLSPAPGFAAAFAARRPCHVRLNSFHAARRA